MQPAADTVLISLGSQVFRLKASLRAAAYLHEKYGGFGKLANAIAEGSFTVFLDVIEQGCADPAALNVFMKPFHGLDNESVVPLGHMILANREELLEFALMLSGAKHEGEKPANPDKSVTVEDYHRMLFEFGTGWLGWTPDQTREASPDEIMIAAGGRKKLLAAIFGGKKDEANEANISDADARAELNALGDLSITSTRRMR